MRHLSHRAALLAVALGAGCAGGPTPKQRESAEIHTNLGLDALRSGRTQEALSEFDGAIQSDPALAEAHLGRGLVLDFTPGRQAEAEAAYRQAIALKPTLSEAHNNLGQLLARQGRLELAVQQFDAALENMYYREPYVARCNKGQALYRLGRKEEGRAELRTCLSTNPRYCSGHRELGRILLEEGKAKEALVSLQRYAQACEKEPDAWYQVGLAQLKLGEAEGAKEAFRRCQELGGEGDLGAECRRSRELLQQ
jgi:type IV pilus biogenesis/stability protein PilW